MKGRRLPKEVWLWNLITVATSCGFGLIVILIIAISVGMSLAEIEKGAAGYGTMHPVDNVYSADAAAGNFTQDSVRA